MKASEILVALDGKPGAVTIPSIWDGWPVVVFFGVDALAWLNAHINELVWVDEKEWLLATEHGEWLSIHIMRVG